MAAIRSFKVKPEPGLEQYHVYHAEAHILSGELKHPVKQPIEFEGHVVLANTRREGHVARSTAANSLEGLISFKAAHTRASGNKIEKTDLWGNDHSGWVTLSTSIIEGLNVFEVITADRVVAQVSTEHPVKYGHVPKVTFLGTRFDNLRVGGYPVELKFNFGICGDRPKGDRPYIEDAAFLNRVRKQLNGIARTKGLPKSLQHAYKEKVANVGQVRSLRKANGLPRLTCSLVTSIKPIPELGVQTFGNVMVIPDFGTVALGELEVGIEAPVANFPRPRISAVSKKDRNGGPMSNYFLVHMINMQLGCIGGGKVQAGSAKANGMTMP